jgi:hypothetical protein
MARRYYSSRKQPGSLTLHDLYQKLQNLFLLFREKDYFKEAGVSRSEFSEEMAHEAALSLTFPLFPIDKWTEDDITEDHIFDALEFLHDHVSRPGPWTALTTNTGWNYYDYDGYDGAAGRAEFRERANIFLADYKSGYELNDEGSVLALGTDGLQHILGAEIVPYDEKNVDSRVRRAILKWRNRQLSLDEKRAAIRDLADVFEWLKKARNLSAVLDKKDESAIFDIANNFAIRHHEPKQKGNYDPAVWYSWIFHFYLASYHAAVRLLIKHEQKGKTA